MLQEAWCPACRQNVVPRWSPDERQECPRCANPLEPSFIPPAPGATSRPDTDPFASPEVAADLDALLAQTRSKWRSLTNGSATLGTSTGRPAPTRVRIDQAEMAPMTTRTAPPAVPPRRPLTAHGSEDANNFPPAFSHAAPDLSDEPADLLPAFAAFFGVFILGAGATLVLYGQFHPGTRLTFVGELLTLAGQLVLLLGVVGLITAAVRRTGRELSAHTAALVAKWHEFHAEWKDELRRTEELQRTVSTPAQLRRRLNELAQDIDRLAS